MYDKDRSSLATDGLMRIRVVGDPQPFPKKIMSTRGKHSMLIDMDWRTRKVPGKIKPQRYDEGYKRQWMAHVARSVTQFMFDHNLEPFPRNHPVAIGTLFFMPKSKVCKLEFPSQKPDWDNMDYAINNALGNSRKKQVLGLYPDGVLFWDDNQPVWRIEPDGMVWANEFNPPGVLISCQSAYEYRERINKWVIQKQEILL